MDVISKSIEMEAELNNFEIFDIGSFNSMRINEIADFIISVVGSSSRIVGLTSKLLHDFDAFIDVSKANRVSS